MRLLQDVVLQACKLNISVLALPAVGLAFYTPADGLHRRLHRLPRLLVAARSLRLALPLKQGAHRGLGRLQQQQQYHRQRQGWR